MGNFALISGSLRREFYVFFLLTKSAAVWYNGASARTEGSRPEG